MSHIWIAGVIADRSFGVNSQSIVQSPFDWGIRQDKYTGVSWVKPKGIGLFFAYEVDEFFDIRSPE